MKFGAVPEGRLSRKSTELPLDGAQWDAEAGKYAGGTVVPVDVRVLSPSEWAEVLSGAREFAMASGVDKDNATPGNELYDYGIRLWAVAFAVTDPESPKDDPKPFFEGGVAQILASRRLTPEHVALLHAEWDAYQAEANPRGKALTPAQWWSTTLGIAKKEDEESFRFFFRLSPSMQWSYARSLASQYIALLGASSSSGSDAASTTPDPQPPPH